MSSYSAQSARPTPSGGVNPFARALAEARGGDHNLERERNLLNSQDASGANSPLIDQKEQQRQLLEKQRREQLRLELHRKVNPVDQKDVFNAREQQVKQEIDKLRYELKKFAEEVKLLQKDVELTLLTNVSHPGQEGKYYLSFFQKLREFISLLRQRVHSARTWAKAFQGKKARKGLDFSVKGHAQTKTVWDSMNNERQIARAGG